jgi:hypothetical protein
MNLIDQTIEYLKQIKTIDLNDQRIRQLEEKLDFMQNKNGTIDDMYTNGMIDYEEYKRRLVALNLKKNKEEFGI